MSGGTLDQSKNSTIAGSVKGREWMAVVARYREPSIRRSIFEIVITALPFLILWGAAWAAMSVSYWLTLLIAIPAAAMLVRLFLIQHDCGHYAFFKTRRTNDWTGRIIGVLTMTPYEVWRRNHATHHANSGNLDQRGVGDIETWTV
ncbi:MAG: fatty acid desaturase, partial [Hyphomicrobiaceae bacterium]